MSTPEKLKLVLQPESESRSRRSSQQNKMNRLALPPIAPSKRERRGSDNYEIYLMPPKMGNRSPMNRNNSSEKISQSRVYNALVQAGKEIVGQAYQIPYPPIVEMPKGKVCSWFSHLFKD